MATRILVVTYHFVIDVPDSFPSLKTVRVDDFRKQLDLLKSNYHPLTIDNLRRALNEENKLPPEGFLLTFDHGTRDHIDNVLPELIKRDLEGSFFIMTSVPENKALPVVDKQRFLEGYFPDYNDFYARFTQECLELAPFLCQYVEPTKLNLEEARNSFRQFPFYSDHERLFRKIRAKYLSRELYEQVFNKLFSTIIGDEESFIREYYLNWDDIATIKRAGMSIGSHGHNHLVYSESNVAACSEDVKESFALLRKRLNCLEIDSIAYPNGGYNQKLYDLFSELQINFAFITHPKTLFSISKRYEIGRIDTTQLRSYCKAT